MKVLKWFKGLSLGKKSLLVGGLLLALIIATPTPSEENSGNIKDNDINQLNSQQKVDLSEQKTIDTTETKTETKTEIIRYESTTKNDSSIEQGRRIKSVSGVNGERTVTYEVTYENGSETSRKEVSNEITKQPVTEIVLIGTKAAYVAPAPAASNCDPNYAGGCVPNVSYDLNCPDIGFMVRVVGTDKHRFDGDKDGYGCESYN